MKKIYYLRVTAATGIALSSGALLHLNADQADRRKPFLKKLPLDPEIELPPGEGMYELTAPTQFKRGEVFGLIGAPDRTLELGTEWLNPIPDPVIEPEPTEPASNLPVLSPDLLPPTPKEVVIEDDDDDGEIEEDDDEGEEGEEDVVGDADSPADGDDESAPKKKKRFGRGRNR